MAFIASLWLALSFSFYALTVGAQDFAIDAYIISGTGCAPGSVTTNVSDDSKNIAVYYNSFTANAGPSYSVDDNRKNCQLTLSVKTPAGYQFAFDKFSHDGSYSIGSGVKASFKTTYYFQSSLDEAAGSGTSVGPARLDGTFASSFSPVIWSPCGRSSLVGINTALRVDNSANTAASGSFTLRTTPSTSFVWRKC
ncbi:hypothetical protein M413DRAFT_188049 [Hebeloma cylindrosporum]|uniref:DUF4360 domain-containing protein n=1 Tax=Hebeloma cylindrosporum TaxID=76867 RepID=A0A0C3C8L8_HEBCY|nr:hypothetical protein M413DRAFT_188049 [Hebeloma cylindrosporum h7]